MVLLAVFVDILSAFCVLILWLLVVIVVLYVAMPAFSASISSSVLYILDDTLSFGRYANCTLRGSSFCFTRTVGLSIFSSTVVLSTVDFLYRLSFIFCTNTLSSVQSGLVWYLSEASLHCTVASYGSILILLILPSGFSTRR